MGTSSSIHVQTERPAYVCGEVVNGAIFLNATSPVESDGVFLKIKGVEKVRWEVDR